MITFFEALDRAPDAVWLTSAAFLFAYCCGDGGLNLRHWRAERSRWAR